METTGQQADAIGPASAQVAPPRPGAEAGRALRAATLATLVLLALGAAAGWAIRPNWADPIYLQILAQMFALRQDVPVAAGMAVLLVGCGLLRSRRGLMPAMPSLTARGALIANGVLVLGAWLLRTRLLFDLDFSRDEQMATFDAAIFASGRLFWPLPADLRAFYQAFNDLFLFPVPDHSAWVSNYLPVNALIRALAGQILPPALVSPLLTGLAGILLWRISRRLWPDDGKTQLVVLACFAGSSQVVLTATTTFAMSTHLALNLLWLACFLRGTRLGHAGAIATGFLATGIHQIAFHPLFVLPFLELLARRRQWSTLACYLVGYAAIGLFWAEWPHWLMSQILPHPVPGSTAAAAEVGLFNRIAGMIGPLSRDAILVMGCNVLRFVTWQHLLLVPLALVGVRKCVGSDDVARALAQGVVLLLLVLLILIPPQGHGWGYRYLHGLIGSCCLLAGYGWRWLAARDGAPVRAMQVATLASVLVLIPVHLWMARGMLAPTAEAKAAIARTGADIAVVETGLIPFGSNLVINRPDLSNRPLLLESGMVTPANLAALCRGRSVTFVDANRFDDVVQYYGARPLTAVGPHQLLLRQAAADAGCRQIAFVR